MKFTAFFSLIIIIGYFLSSCSGGRQRDEDIYVHVDFVGAERQSLYVEDVFDCVEFIPLETSYSCLLTEEPLILAVTDSFVVLSNMMRDAFLFDRKDGRFVQQVGKRGNGPDEYYFLVFDACFDQYHNILYTNKGDKWVGINIRNNKVEDRVVRPKISDKDGILSIVNPYRMNDSLYIGYVNNLTGKEKMKLVVFNRNGEVVKYYSNTLFYEMEKEELISFCPGYFYHYGTDLHFYGGLYKDTLYTVKEERVYPKYSIALNERSPYETWGTSEYDSNNYHYLIRMMEYEPYLLFSYFEKGRLGPGVGLYDKKRNRTLRSESKDGGFLFRESKVPSFLPRYMDDNGYVVGYWTSAQWMDFMKGQKGVIKIPDALFSVKEDDNPIIVIARTKK